MSYSEYGVRIMKPMFTINACIEYSGRTSVVSRDIACFSCLFWRTMYFTKRPTLRDFDFDFTCVKLNDYVTV